MLDLTKDREYIKYLFKSLKTIKSYELIEYTCYTLAVCMVAYHHGKSLQPPAVVNWRRND